MSECLADISTWTTAHHLKLNLDKTELLLVSAKDCPHMDLLVTVEDMRHLHHHEKPWCGTVQPVMLHPKHHRIGPKG